MKETEKKLWRVVMLFYIPIFIMCFIDYKIAIGMNIINLTISILGMIGYWETIK